LQQNLNKRPIEPRTTAQRTSATRGAEKGVRNLGNIQYQDERTAFINRMQQYSDREASAIEDVEEIIEETKEQRTLKNKARRLKMATFFGSLAVLGYALGYCYGYNVGSDREEFSKEEIERMLDECVEYDEWEEEIFDL